MASASKSKVYFFFLNHSFSLNNRKRLKDFIESIFKKEGKKLERISFIFCSDTYLLGLNKEFLNHNFYTDILTFNLSEKNKPVKAEVYISIDRVRENSQTLEISFKTELLRVIFHGTLHLCGYKDKIPAQSSKMRNREDFYINGY